jgi:hypothetical protein
MHPLRTALPILAAALLTACATRQVGYDYDESVDFSRYQHWTWSQPAQQSKDDDDPLIDNPLLRQRIENAVARTLSAKGYRQSDPQVADFNVGYFLTVENKLSSSGVSTSFGFGRYSGGSGVGVSIGGPGTRVREQEEGTLIIDVVDRISGKLVWRGSSTRVLGQARTPEESERVVHETVTGILANFPPPAGN